MLSDPRFDALVAPLREDLTSGASRLAQTAAGVLRRAAIRLQAGSIEELRWGLGQVSHEVLAAQPSMAPLITLVREVMTAAQGASSLEQGRLAAAQAADDFRNGYDGRLDAVAEQALGVLPQEGRVATLSSSETVRRALVRWHRASPPAGERRVLCLESRPGDEGRTLAGRLSQAGIEVTYAVDAAVHRLMTDCAAAVIGADSIGDAGIVNKIGSIALATSAREAGLPVYVLVDSTKSLPPGEPQTVEDPRPPRDVWPEPPTGVSVWNQYFEVVPFELVTSVVMESRVLPPDRLRENRGRLAQPGASSRPRPNSSE